MFRLPFFLPAVSLMLVSIPSCSTFILGKETLRCSRCYFQLLHLSLKWGVNRGKSFSINDSGPGLCIYKTVQIHCHISKLFKDKYPVFSTTSKKQTTGIWCWAKNSTLVIPSTVFSSPCQTSNISKTMQISNGLFTQCHLAHSHVRKSISF